MKQNQASGLEHIMEPQSIFNKRGKTKFVAITSGKGGVGKSTISANLAYSLFKAGYKVGVLDADIGLANLDIIFGIKTTKNILHALRGEAHFSEVVYPIEEGFYLVPGDSGEEIFKYVSQDILDSFVDEENLLDDLDYMIIDTGAGIGEFTQAFLRASDCVVVITTSDPAAITDAYTTIKVNSKTKDDAFVLVNMVDSAEKGLQIFGGIQRVAKENIPNMTLNYLGYIQNNNAVKRSIKDRKLLCKSEPFNAFSFSMNQIVKILTMKIEQGVLETPKDNFIGFFKRLLRYL
ncbi:P-loop NTPase [Helicobacter suis]|uniref:ATP-binding protein (YlxH) n=3 Tax=Helicobacter suis TaxID=104628 RepID=E7G2N8_9HELI|nr:P-loop NTPase [Helicobacter suis]EFX42387.1 ATP-binding protein (ylxH) [Helicobacter suis HS5]EFX43124.1 ATP-binding protein (YlxH) [Helicobacter suis HS1]BCD46738.1 ATP-binding protein ylxH [Helicobacter suis]BCD48512.1 ATP-binding protein ylxH [Helicobacter suis]BCD50291.1 ATP-binding protein ylxH [Helicobacter suis]